MYLSKINYIEEASFQMMAVNILSDPKLRIWSLFSLVEGGYMGIATFIGVTQLDFGYKLKQE